MSALTQLKLEQYTIQGASLGGLYTALHIPELSSLFDAGLALRSGVGASRLFLSHAHLDHIGALGALLGMRGMVGRKEPLELYCPRGTEEGIARLICELSALHTWPLEVNLRPLSPGEEQQLSRDLWVRALRTFHPVPSLGYLIYERVKKLSDDYRGLSGREIKALKDRGVEVHRVEERPRVAYLTDTLPEALKHSPEALEADVLIIECTFIDDHKGVEVARAGCHIHLDELERWAPLMRNRAVVLMHFSQIHKPRAIRERLEARLGPILGERLHLFLPQGDDHSWWI